MTERIVAREAVAQPAEGIEGIDVPAAAFVDRPAFNLVGRRQTAPS